jgi:hypothetical protein
MQAKRAPEKPELICFSSGAASFKAASAHVR